MPTTYYIEYVLLLKNENLFFNKIFYIFYKNKTSKKTVNRQI